MRYAIDPTKIHQELGWLPETPFAEGIERTIRWYVDNKAWWRPSSPANIKITMQKCMGIVRGRQMKIFVTGAAGQLGLDVMKELQARGIEAVGSDLAVSCGDRWTGMGLSPDAYRQLDITDPSTVDQVLNDLHPDAVIHCAAWTAVDLAEDPNNLRKVRAINGEGTHIASMQRLDCATMYISTDYVFSGQGTQPWHRQQGVRP